VYVCVTLACVEKLGVYVCVPSGCDIHVEVREACGQRNHDAPIETPDSLGYGFGGSAHRAPRSVTQRRFEVFPAINSPTSAKPSRDGIDGFVVANGTGLAAAVPSCCARVANQPIIVRLDSVILARVALRLFIEGHAFKRLCHRRRVDHSKKVGRTETARKRHECWFW